MPSLLRIVGFALALLLILVETRQLRPDGSRSRFPAATIRRLVRYLGPYAVVTRALNGRYTSLPASVFSSSVRIVDAGGGPMDARKAKRLFAQCWYEGINIAELPPPGSEAHGYDRYHLLDLDATDLAFLPDRSYDLVVSSHTIEHLKDGLAVVERLCRKVKPGGRLYLEWPSVQSTTFPVRGLGLRFDDDPTHRKAYALDDVRRLVEREGLRIERAGVRRQWLRILLAPILVPYHSVRVRRPVLYDLWDITGFANSLRAVRPADD
jgi:SAM-dependent methyltransferase